MIHGVLPVYKPKGYTSHDVVHHVRRSVGQKRVGHTGTLDPEVEGVLPICLGQATRIVEYIQDLPKRYQGEMTLGFSTTTEDQMGDRVEEAEVGQLTATEVESVFRSFRGEITQIPPMYSAVKVDGKRLYEWARKGEVIERKSRKVQIHSFDLLSIKPGKNPTIAFDVTCSKGTYIRTLCVDVGRALGYPAHLSFLVRTKSGPFGTADCIGWQEIEQLGLEEKKQPIVFSIGEVLGHLPSVIIQDHDVQHIQNGLPLDIEEIQNDFPKSSLVRVYSESGQFCAVYCLDQDSAKPEKVFRELTDVNDCYESD